VRVFFGFSDAELAQPVVRDPRTQRVLAIFCFGKIAAAKAAGWRRPSQAHAASFGPFADVSIKF
jgi:hypothetical protein